MGGRDGHRHRTASRASSTPCCPRSTGATTPSGPRPVRGGPPLATDPGQLRGFLDLPGGELDRLYSLNRAALLLTNLDRVDGRLLPLLAQWIGWRTDYSLPVGAQRNEIRFAPRIYRTVGCGPHAGRHGGQGHRLGQPHQGVRAQRRPQQPAGAAEPVVGAARRRGELGGTSTRLAEFRLQRPARRGARGRRLGAVLLPHLPAARLGHLGQALRRRRLAAERSR